MDVYLRMTLKPELPVVCNQTWIVTPFGLHVGVEQQTGAERLVTVIRSTWESALAESLVGYSVSPPTAT